MIASLVSLSNRLSIKGTNVRKLEMSYYFTCLSEIKETDSYFASRHQGDSVVCVVVDRWINLQNVHQMFGRNVLTDEVSSHWFVPKVTKMWTIY